MFSDASSHARESVQYKTGQYGRSQVIHFAMALLVSWVYSADVKVQYSTVSTVRYFFKRYGTVRYFSIVYGTFLYGMAQ